MKLRMWLVAGLLLLPNTAPAKLSIWCLWSFLLPGQHSQPPPRPEVPPPAVVAPAAPPFSEARFTAAEKPPTPESSEYEVLSIKADPNYPDNFLYHVKPKKPVDQLAPFERGQLFNLLKNNPALLAKFGIVQRADGSIEYPNAEGFNARVKKMIEANDPDAPSLMTWSDRSANETGKIELARAWTKGQVPFSAEGKDADQKSLHFHDLTVHLVPYLVLPKSVVRNSRARVAALLLIYDNPVLSENAEFKRQVGEKIEEVVSRIDTGSATVARFLERPAGEERTLNLGFALSSLCVGSKSVKNAFPPAILTGLTGPQKAELNRLLASFADEDIPVRRAATETEAHFFRPR